MDPLAPLLALLPQAMVHDRRWAEPRLETLRRRLAAGQPGDHLLKELTSRLDASVAEATRRGALPLTLAYPDLPVSARRDEILASLRRHPVLVLTGETGSGKTTQLPKMLLEAGYGRRGLVALTQPRRVAAVAMADRIRHECQAAPDVIAHSVRFDDHASPDTIIRVLTDGLLLAEAGRDPDLSRYDSIILDEAHERSLNIDLLIGLLVLLRRRRPDLALVVSSASIAAERFAQHLDAPTISVSGRMFPVEIIHQAPADDDTGYQDAAVDAITGLCGPDMQGDILAFLPTERDILEAQRRLKDLPGTAVLPLFSRLTPSEQARVFQPPPGRAVRKVVLATNIAETSLTIPGVRYVVDAGLARLKRFQAGTRTERLPIEPISRASATQRAGRAGRVEAGVCIRLYAEDDLAKRDEFTPPEILRSNLAGVLLTCLRFGIRDPGEFPWLDAPPPGAWQQAANLLDELGAITADQPPRRRGNSPSFAGLPASPEGSALPPHVSVQAGAAPPLRSAPDGAPPPSCLWQLTPLGRTLAAIPADPQVARILVAGTVEGCPHEACTIAAFLSVQDPRVRPLGQEAKADAAHKSFAHPAGDLATILRLWDRWEAAAGGSARNKLCASLFLGFRRMREWADVRHQLWQALREGRDRLPGHGAATEEWPLDSVHRSVLAGMLGNVLHWDATEKAWRGAGDRLMHVHPGSALKAAVAEGDKKTKPPEWLVACEVVETSRLFARLCAPIDPAWVIDLAGHRVKRKHRDPHYHPKRRMVVCTETVTWKGLPVQDGRLVPFERVDPGEAQRVYIREALAGDDGTDHPQIAANRRVFSLARSLRERLRDPGLDIEREHLETWYAERLGGSGSAGRPAGSNAGSAERQLGSSPSRGGGGANSGSAGRPADSKSNHAELALGAPSVIASDTALTTWLKKHGPLHLSLADLTSPEHAAAAETGAPDAIVLGGREFPLRYVFAPGADDDGVTLTIHESDLPHLDVIRCDWAVPAWRAEIIGSYLTQLPKDDRRRLIPLAETAKALAAALAVHAGKIPVAMALTQVLRSEHRLSGSFDPGLLPPWQRLRYVIKDGSGAVTYAGRDPAFLGTGGGSDRLRMLRAEWETAPAAVWPGEIPGGLPGQVGHGSLSGWVALGRCRAADGTPAVRRTVYASEAAARAWHDDGLASLMESALGSDLEALIARPMPMADALRLEKHLGIRPGALRRHAALAAVADLDRGPIRDGEAFAHWLSLARPAARQGGQDIDAVALKAVVALERLRDLQRRGARSLGAAACLKTATDVITRLTAPGWSQRLPWGALRRLDRFLEAQLALITKADPPKAVAERTAGLLNLWDQAADVDAPRLLPALGLGQRWRNLNGILHECALALALGQQPQAAEHHLRLGLDDVGRRLDDARAVLAGARQSLVEAGLVLPRITVKSRREALTREHGDLLRSFPDLTVGCDIGAQVAQAQALCARIRAALA